MKTTSFLTLKTFVAMAAVAMICGGTSCSSSHQDAENQKEATAEMADSNIEAAEANNDAKFDNAKEDDADFMMKVAETNMLEIHLGQLAQKNAMTKEVKDLGKMMETAHTKAQADLEAMAGKKQVTLPTMLSSDGKECEDKLMKKTGSEFEKEYCDKMVKGHEETIEKFEKAAKDAADPDLKAWASSMLPELRTHLDHAISAQKKVDKKS